MRTRQEIRSAAAPWSAPLLWYARGVGVLQKRPISDKASWLFLAAMHGIDPDAWAQFGYLSDGTSLSEDPQNPAFWNQCQHQTWYFWPWHRAYLWTFEDIVSAAIVSLGGPGGLGAALLELQRHEGFRRKRHPKGIHRPDDAGRVAQSALRGSPLRPGCAGRRRRPQSQHHLRHICRERCEPAPPGSEAGPALLEQRRERRSRRGLSP